MPPIDVGDGNLKNIRSVTARVIWKFKMFLVVWSSSLNLPITSSIFEITNRKSSIMQLLGAWSKNRVPVVPVREARPWPGPRFLLHCLSVRSIKVSLPVAQQYYSLQKYSVFSSLQRICWNFTFQSNRITVFEKYPSTVSSTVLSDMLFSLLQQTMFMNQGYHHLFFNMF